MAYRSQTTHTAGRDGMEHRCDPCLFDEQKKDAAGFCFVCIEYLCNDCLNYHRRMKVSRHHKILMDDALPSNARPFQQMLNLLSCQSHPEKDVEYKCEDHQAYICGSCLGNTHRKCKRIKELAKVLNTGTDYENGKKYQERLKQLTDSTVVLRKEKERRIEFLQAEINKENLAVENIVTRESEQKECLGLLETTLKYGDPKQVNIAVNSMSATMERLQRESEVQPEVKAMMGTIIVTTRGPVQLQNKSNPRVDPSIENSSYCEDESSSDSDTSVMNAREGSQKYKVCKAMCDKEIQVDCDFNKQEKGVQVNMPLERENKNKESVRNHVENRSAFDKGATTQYSQKPLSLMERHIVPVGSYKICVEGDWDPCSIVASVVLPSVQQVVLLDNGNEKIKVFDYNFQFLGCLMLDDVPFSVCRFGENSIAVTYDNLKRIERFNVYDTNMESDGGFPMKLYGRGITHIAGHDVAVLCTDQPRHEYITSRTSIVEVQIRDVNTGEILKTIDSFQDWQSNAIELINPWWLVSRNEGELLVSEVHMLRCFDYNGDLGWFYTSRELSGINAINIDKEGNVYACGIESGNVHQICGSNYRNNRIVVQNLEQPISVVFDSENGRLLVGCAEHDYIYVYQFE